jgi:hypothetical protein
MNGLITALGKGKVGDKAKGKDEFPPAKGKDKKKGAKDEDDDEDDDMNGGPGKPAMDAAIITITKNVTGQIAAKFKAAKEVAPYVGEVDPMAFDSAADIFKYALTSGEHKVDLTDVHRSAYRSLLPLLPRADAQELAAPLAMDAKVQSELEKKYTHIPSKG